MIPAREALERLREGNRRFVAGAPSHASLTSAARRDELTEGQEPFAIILGCSDSRVPAEMVFDQGLGDLFVIRVAGNIVAPSQVGSVEFAAERFHTRLVVVLGHSGCGAILATLDEIRREDGVPSRNLRSIVDRVRPAVEPLLRTELRHEPEALVREAVRANIRASVDHLRHGSDVLEALIRGNGLVVVGAEYSLETGQVEFFDARPAPPITVAEFEKRLAAVCGGGASTGLPRRHRDRHILFRAAAQSLDESKVYSETDVNRALASWLMNVETGGELDHVALRRHLVDFGYLARDREGAEYRSCPAGRGEMTFEPGVSAIDAAEFLRTARDRAEARKREWSRGPGEPPPAGR